MRHGDRLDNFEELWVMKAERPWDPPLHQDGKIRAFCTGQKIRSSIDFPIHRVFVSPFLRCVQTAAEVVRALCDVADHNGESNVLSSNSDSVIIDPSKVKVQFLSFFYLIFCWMTIASFLSLWVLGYKCEFLSIEFELKLLV